MAPDKIWVTPSELTELLSEKRHDYDVAYIRKDALIEWLDKNVKGLNVLFGEIFIAKVKDKLKQL